MRNPSLTGRGRATGMFIFIFLILTQLSAFGEKQLTIMFLNDTHGHIYPWTNPENGRVYGGAARWATIVQEARGEADSLLFLHAGDMFTGSGAGYLDRGQPDWERLPGYGYRGTMDVEVFNRLGLDAIVIGNHELDYGYAWFHHVMQEAKFDILSSNMQLRPAPPTDEFTGNPLHRPYIIYELEDITVGVIGLTTSEYIKTNQVSILNQIDPVGRYVAEISDKVDIVVVLSHLGYEEDRTLAAAVDGIDIIVGGHSHTLVSSITRVNGTVVAQARAFGEFLGKLDIMHEGREITEIRQSLIPTSLTVPEDPQIREFLDEIRIVGRLDAPLESDETRLSTLGEFVTSAMVDRSSADVGIVLSGLFAGRLPDGDVTAQDFFTVFWPYRSRSNPPEYDLSARQIIDALTGTMSSFLRPLVYQASQVDTLVRFVAPSSLLETIRGINDRYSGRSEYLQVGFGRAATSDRDLAYVMDIQSWRQLYREGALTEGFDYEILELRMTDVALDALNATR